MPRTLNTARRGRGSPRTSGRGRRGGGGRNVLDDSSSSSSSFVDVGSPSLPIDLSSDDSEQSARSSPASSSYHSPESASSGGVVETSRDSDSISISSSSTSSRQNSSSSSSNGSWGSGLNRIPPTALFDSSSSASPSPSVNRTSSISSESPGSSSNMSGVNAMIGASSDSSSSSGSRARSFCSSVFGPRTAENDAQRNASAGSSRASDSDWGAFLPNLFNLGQQDIFANSNQPAASTSQARATTSTSATAIGGSARTTAAPSTSTAISEPTRNATTFECSVCLETLDTPATISLSPTLSTTSSTSIDLDNVFEGLLVHLNPNIPEGFAIRGARRGSSRGRRGSNRATATAREESTSLTDVVATGCGHLYHHVCIMKWFRENGRRTCPSCRKLVPASKLIRLYPNASDADARAHADSVFQGPNSTSAGAPQATGSVSSLIELDDNNGNGSNGADGRCAECQDLKDIHNTLMNDYTDLQERYNNVKEEEEFKNAQIYSLLEDNARKDAEIARLKSELRENHGSGTPTAASTGSAKRRRQ